MGGRRWNRKTTVEECRAIGVSDLRRLGVLRWEQRYWPITWQGKDGEVAASIGLEVEEGPGALMTLWFSYTVGKPEEEKESLRYPVHLVSEPCYFGGERWWFICPLVRGGQPCGRRVGKLYLPTRGKYFGCRHCYDLTYRSVQEHDKRVDALLRGEADEFLERSRSGDWRAAALMLKAWDKARKRLRME